MIPAWLRNPVGPLLLCVLLLGMVGAVSLAAEIGQPFGGFASNTVPQANGAMVHPETPAWWPIGRVRPSLLGLGDLLLANGQPFRTDARAVFAAAWAAGERSVTLAVHWPSEDVRADVQVAVIPFTLSHYLDIKLPDLIVGFCFWLTALTVLRARPAEPLNQIFATLAALVATHRWLAVHTIWNDARPLPTFLDIPQFVAGHLIGVMLIHFTLLFPQRVKPWPHRSLRLAYLFSAVLALSSVLRIAPVSDQLGSLYPTLALTAYNTTLVVYVAGVVLLFGRLTWLWLRGRRPRRERRIVGIVLLGLVVAAPFLWRLANPIAPGTGEEMAFFWQGQDLGDLLLVIPLALALVITRYQSMRSPSRLLIAVTVLALSGLLAAFLSGLWTLSQVNWPADGQHPPFPYLFAGILAASAIWSTQANWRGWFGRLLAWETQSYEAARRFGRRVSGLTTPPALAQAMADALVAEFKLVRAAIWLWQEERGVLALAAKAGETSPSLPADLSMTEADRVRAAANRPLRLYAVAEIPAWLAPLGDARLLDVAVPLFAEGQPIGLLGLGHRWDEETFDERDLTIVELIGQQAALFLLAAMQVEQLRGVPQRIVQAQERERLRLAGELHDTVQQFLGRLPFALAYSRDEIRADPDGVAIALERCLDDAGATAETVRRMRFALAPSYLTDGLERSLRVLVAHVERRSELRINLDAEAWLDEATTPATREALYRVVQQALDNVVAHAAATEAIVHFGLEDSRVTVTIADNGRGCTPAERHAAQAGQHFGLFSMEARLKLCGGGFEFASGVGEGTEVTGWVPAERRA